MLGDIGVSPRGQVLKIPALPDRVSPLRMRCCLDPRLLSCTKGDLIATPMGEARFVLGIPLQLDRNRFESPSLPDSENLTEQRQRRFTSFNDMVKWMMMIMLP